MGGTAISDRVVRKDLDNMTFEKRRSEIRERATGLSGGRALGQRAQHSGFPGPCGGAYTEEQGGQHGGGREEMDGSQLGPATMRTSEKQPTPNKDQKSELASHRY